MKLREKHDNESNRRLDPRPSSDCDEQMLRDRALVSGQVGAGTREIFRGVVKKGQSNRLDKFTRGSENVSVPVM